ncbi:hypothetical protein EC991_006347 [Linnemannia zychae]|nr:hypothetical protein EC991_006347 [Linnemannia zychae]
MPSMRLQLNSDILQHLATSYLTPPDLLSCVLVSKAWNEEFIPYLWESIDDCLHSWPKILNRHDAKSSRHNKDEAWIRATFAKHAHHIRYLRVQWKVVLAAVAYAKTCTNLLSLRIGDLSSTKTALEQMKGVPPVGGGGGRGGETYLKSGGGGRGHVNLASRKPWQLEETMSPWPLLCQEFEGKFLPLIHHNIPLPQQERDWMVFQCIWLLLLQNPALRSVKLSRDIAFLGKIESQKYPMLIIGNLKNLVELQDFGIFLELNEVLERLPNIMNYSGNKISSYNINKEHRQLRELWIGDTLPESQVLDLLDNLPSLQQLWITGIPPYKPDDLPIPPASRRYSLRSLGALLEHGVTEAPTAIIARAPFLVEFVTDLLTSVTAHALVKHCPHLEIVRQPSYVEPQRNAYPLRPPLDALLILLQGCQNLKVVDMFNHKVSSAKLTAHPWKCLQLEVLRFQVVDVPRITASEQQWLNEGMRILNTTDEEILYNDMKDLLSSSFSHGLEEYYDHNIFYVMATREEFLVAQRLVMDQLGKLKDLRVLDFGYDYRENDPSTYRVQQGEPDGVLGAPFYVVPNTLELWMRIGLKKLAALNNLEVFGFEGVDHRLRKSEIKWMAESWPKLKVMHGLQEERLGIYTKNTELREYMQTLRPDVKHLAKLPCPYDLPKFGAPTDRLSL